MKTKNIVCEVCEETFQIRQYTIKYKDGREMARFPGTKYCSKKCCSAQNYLKHKEYYQNYQKSLPTRWAWRAPKVCDVCETEFHPKSPKSKTCSRKCSIKRWKLLNPERNKEYNRESYKRCRKIDPERYRFSVKNRRHKIREASGNISGKVFSTAFTLSEWEEIKKENDNKCVLCKKNNIKLTIDHIIPLSRGGAHSKENIQPLCHSCNSGKKDKILDLAAYSS